MIVLKDYEIEEVSGGEQASVDMHQAVTGVVTWGGGEVAMAMAAGSLGFFAVGVLGAAVGAYLIWDAIDWC